VSGNKNPAIYLRTNKQRTKYNISDTLLRETLTRSPTFSFSSTPRSSHQKTIKNKTEKIIDSERPFETVEFQQQINGEKYTKFDIIISTKSTAPFGAAK
jgi:hypothetical protein